MDKTLKAGELSQFASLIYSSLLQYLDLQAGRHVMFAPD